MSPRLRIAASVTALAAAWWLGILAERSRSGAAGREAGTHEAAHQPGDAAATARRDAARAAEMRAAHEEADVFTSRMPTPPRDLAASIAAARQAPSDVQRVRRMIIATGDLTAEEIPAALALAMRSGTDKEEKSILRLAVLARWAEIDPPAAAAYATQLPGAADNMEGEILKTVVGEWGVRAPAAAADFVANLDDEKRGKAVAGLLAGVAASQPETALALLARFPEAAKDSASYLAIFGAWSDRDPRGAAARAGTLPPGAFRARAFAGVAQHWTQHDPAAAYSWVTQLGDPDERKAALETLMRTWADSDPQSAANQALGLADAKLLRGVSDTLARALAQSDLPAAERFAAQLADEDARASAQWMVALRMSDKSVADATAYAGRMPEGQPRASAFYSLSATWVLKDPVTTAQWLGTLPASGSRDSAVAAYVETAVELDPESAMAWAGSMSGVDERTKTTTKAYEAWQKKAPQAAQAWLDANRTLPDDLRAALTPRK